MASDRPMMLFLFELKKERVNDKASLSIAMSHDCIGINGTIEIPE